MTMSSEDIKARIALVHADTKDKLKKEGLSLQEKDKLVNLRLVLEELVVDIDKSLGEKLEFGLLSLEELVEHVNYRIKEALV